MYLFKLCGLYPFVCLVFLMLCGEAEVIFYNVIKEAEKNQLIYNIGFSCSVLCNMKQVTPSLSS